MKHTCYKHPAIYGSSDPGWSHDQDPCTCNCDKCLEYQRIQSLPEITTEELFQVEEMAGGATPGPWITGQFREFGSARFIMTQSLQVTANWYPVVAELKNVGNFHADEFVAWCRDGVPRLIKKIRELEAEVERLRDVDVIDQDRDDT